MNQIDQTYLRSLLQDLVDKSGTKTKAAQSLGITITYLSDMIDGRREVSERIADQLGYRKVETWVRKTVD